MADEQQDLEDELRATRRKAYPNMNPQLTDPKQANPSGQPLTPTPAPAPAPDPNAKPKTIREHLQALFDHFGYK
jgi:hypothetical protein